jgi:hypothetical protein
MRVFLDYLSCTRVHLLAYIYSRNIYSCNNYSRNKYSRNKYSSCSYIVDAYEYAWMRMSTHLVHITACNNQL